MTELRNRIAELRQARGWSQERLAAEMHVSVSQVSRVESGDTKLTNRFIRRAAAALQVSELLIVAAEDSVALTERERQALRAIRAIPEGRESAWLDIAQQLAHAEPDPSP